MTYTAQSCREEAAINDKFGDPIMNDPDLLRAHADALEENARLKAEKPAPQWLTDNLLQRAERAEGELAKLRAEANDDDALRERMADILTRTAAALKGEPEPLTLHDWSGLPGIAERVVSDLAKLRQMVAQQAEDEGLWFNAATAPEAYLQQELRKLHAAVEETK